ncbi:uncharacterized protein ARMOST_13681 [Armillaria ostoyae]|uniref:Uncharacterized protein n=1 Tax=Armillaria ostoyae TaxID=47428 RepID=A0A284RNF9_ARMOS|nr:uncharacterized protein ARMOST_13681 [Armillaria ostoyae]
MPYVRSHPLFVNVLCWWKGTELHKQPIFAVPLLPISGWCSVRQRSPMPIDTQAVFTAETLLNIARGSLGGFCIPDSTDSKPRKDNIFRFTFHGQHPETEQKPGRQLSQEDLSMPLKDLVGKILWIKVEGSSLPTKNLTNLRMQPTKEDKSNHPSDWATYIKRANPDGVRCPFTACLSPIACHIRVIECGQNDEAYEALAELSNDIRNICNPKLPVLTYVGEPGFLDAEFPIPSRKHWKLASLPLAETPTNGMILESQFHKTYDKYWWLFYRGEAFWIHDEPCPLFQTYGWDPQMLPADRNLYQGERKPRKIKHRTTKAQLQDLQAIISFFHAFGTTKYFHVIQDVVGRPPFQKRARRGQEACRKRARSSGHDEDEDEDDGTETDDDTGLDSDDEFIVAHKEEIEDAKQRNITAQMMMIWSIQVGQHDTSVFPP